MLPIFSHISSFLISICPGILYISPMLPLIKRKSIALATSFA
jgi:hypothetical protein